jgi:hypothetical protein
MLMNCGIVKLGCSAFLFSGLDFSPLASSLREASFFEAFGARHDPYLVHAITSIKEA